MSNADYHAHPALGSSNLKQILQNPYVFAMGIKQEQTAAMALGSAVHTMVLEPHKFDEEFAIAPEYDGRTKEGKEIRASFEASCIGKTILKQSDYEIANRCRDAVKSAIAPFFKSGIAEASFFSEFDGIAVKCRPDWYNSDIATIVDLKVVQDASPDGFTKAIANFQYYLQSALYIDVLRSLGHDVAKFVFVAVEKDSCNMVGVYELSPEAIDFGRSEIKRAIDIYKRIDEFKRPIFKDTQTGDVVQMLSLPSWVYYRNNASY